MDSYSYWLNEPVQDSSEEHSQPAIQTPEQTPAREHVPTSIVADNLITKLGKMLVRRLAPSPYEPRITDKGEYDGQRQWQVHDPYAGRSHKFASEVEIMIWLDTHRYR